MPKFYGVVGYAETVEEPEGSGVWIDKITERKYMGDVVRNARSLQAGERLHDDISVSNSISILADAYATQNILAIRYVSWLGSLWRVSNVDVQRPRLNLTLGGEYNGPTPVGTSDNP